MFLMNNKKPILSILICTIYGREHFYNRLQNELIRQIKEYNLLGEVQILFSKDRRAEHTIGWKRNLLLQNSDGDYTMFVDDDDMLCDDALFLIIKSIKENNPDVLALEGFITTDGHNKKTFIHSLEYNEWFERDGIYFRPPNHLNPIRSSISKKFEFLDISHGEDMDWSMKIHNSKLLKKESSIGKPYYFYEHVSIK
jgi:glycosyltransferase involved in cell wall biosynthesis